MYYVVMILECFAQYAKNNIIQRRIYVFLPIISFNTKKHKRVVYQGLVEDRVG